ncbi:putative late blight resistance proteinR1B-16 [Sesamum alatum]|uniref:Late blight resistance proteinR1B-16 n=1 Tax=Sesamum alatum TaxID=300844 RepID=A0AAE1YXL5_9LAMI|nr:putative late blight resistance proteinR1B-16 [Sesamum alatum]
MVGLEDEVEDIVHNFLQEAEELEGIPFIGIPGLGKTTIAANIFHHPTIGYEFPIRIWVCVSQEFSKKQLLLAILSNFTRLTHDDMHNKIEEELVLTVRSNLEKTRFLIVMDNVWSHSHWDELNIALPQTVRSKVLTTSRFRRVAYHANHSREPYMLRFLTPEESWKLLQFKAFGEASSPPELESVGKFIATQCNGLPLSLVVIGGVLSGMGETNRMAWEKVSENVSRYIFSERSGMENVISSSYNSLPNHLRRCSLHVGMFAEDFEILVWKLIRIWIAKGFVQPKLGMRLEEIAEDYFEDLINRSDGAK